MHLSWVFPGCFPGVSRVFPGCFPGVPGHNFLSLSFTLLRIPTTFAKEDPLILNISKCTFPWCFPGISRVFPEKENYAREHPGNTRETPGKHPGNVHLLIFCIKGAGLERKKNFFSNTRGDFEQRKH